MRAHVGIAAKVAQEEAGRLVVATVDRLAHAHRVAGCVEADLVRVRGRVRVRVRIGVRVRRWRTRLGLGLGRVRVWVIANPNQGVWGSGPSR